MARIEALPATKDTAEALDLMAQVEKFQGQARELKSQLEAALIEYIDANGPIELGERRWYVGVDKQHKRRVELEAAVGVLLEATSGDLHTFCELLSAGALKPGACRTVLGDRFDELFETVTTKDLKTGAAKRVVKMVDERFRR